MSGQKSSSSESTVIDPTSPLAKKMRTSPCDISIDWRKESSARSPSTSASTSGARG